MSRNAVTAIRDLLRDVVIFLIGIVIILKQAGIFFVPPEHGPEIELIILGGLFCNGPIMLQALALRGGNSSSPPASPPAGPGSPSVPPSASSSGGKP